MYNYISNVLESNFWCGLKIDASQSNSQKPYETFIDRRRVDVTSNFYVSISYVCLSLQNLLHNMNKMNMHEVARPCEFFHGSKTVDMYK